MRMRGNPNLMMLGLSGLSAAYRKTWIRWALGSLLLYGIASAVLVPFLFRQLLMPSISAQTGIGLKVREIHWHPYSLTLQLDEVFVGPTLDVDLIRVAQLNLDFGLVRSLYHRAIAFDALKILNPSIAIHPGADGRTNLDVMMAAIQSRNPDHPDPQDNAPLRLALARMDVIGGSLSFEVQPIESPLQFHSLEIRVRDFMSWEPSPVAYGLSLQLNAQADLKSEGTFVPDGSGGNFSLDARKINLSELQSQLPKSLDLPRIEGELDFSGQFHIGGRDLTQLQLNKSRATVRDLKLSRPQFELPVMTLGKIQMEEGALDLSAHHIDMGALEFKDLGLINTKTSDGIPGWQTLMPQSAPSDSSPVVSPAAKSSEKPWKVGVRHLEMNDLRLLPQGGDSGLLQPDFQVGHWSANGLLVDAAVKAFLAEEISVKDSRLLFGLDKNTLYPLDTLTASPAMQKTNGLKGEGTPSPWSLRINRTELSEVSLGIICLKDSDPRPFELTGIQMDIGAFDTQGAVDTPVKFTSQASSGGKIALSGMFNFQDQSMTADVTLDQMGLTPLKSFLSESYRFGVIEGLLSSQLKFKGRLSEGGADAAYEGGMRLEGLRLTQSPGDRKLLSWRSLTVEGITGKLHPPSFSANEIRVINPDGVIAIREDKASNLSDLKIPSQTESPAKTSNRASKATQREEPDVNIRRIRIEGGKLDYSDLSLVLPFTTQIVDLKGAITGWTSEPTGKSLLELNGRIAPFGEAAIHGQLRPRDPKSSMDIDLHFENVILAALTPYSATFAGRKIQEGKLDLNAHYQLEDQHLESENRIYLKQLRLGDKVESPKAVSLPLDLAVALLSDSDGNIDLSLPIEGRTDAPDFDYGAIVLNAFGNLIKKAVLSPFTALSSALGLQGGNGLDSIAFDLGSDVLTPPEREKIGRLTEALTLKPQLQLTLNGVYAPHEDLLALRQLWLRNEVATRLKEVIKPGEDPDPVNPSEPSSQRVLEALARDHDILNAALAQYESKNGHPPDRVGLVGPLLGKASQTPDFYETLVKTLVEHAPIHQASLQQLAQGRMAAIKAALISSRKPIAAIRVRMGEIQEQSSEDGHHIQMPLSLEID